MGNQNDKASVILVGLGHIIKLLQMHLFFIIFLGHPNLWNPWNNTEMAPTELILGWCVICTRSSRWFLPGLPSWAVPPLAQEKKVPESSLCVYISAWGWTTAPHSQWAAHPWAVCIPDKAQGAQDQRTFSSCVYERCVALHQLACVHSYRAILGESKHASEISAHLHSKKSLHYYSSCQRPGIMSIEQHGLAFEREPSYLIEHTVKTKSVVNNLFYLDNHEKGESSPGRKEYFHLQPARLVSALEKYLSRDQIKTDRDCSLCMICNHKTGL